MKNNNMIKHLKNFKLYSVKKLIVRKYVNKEIKGDIQIIFLQ